MITLSWWKIATSVYLLFLSFQVRAYNRTGKGLWSEPLETISGAGPPDKPREPKAVVKSGTLVSISWDQPINNGAIITGYLLQVKY